jgi:thiol-disulfide isomerase/thioredoxin
MSRKMKIITRNFLILSIACLATFSAFGQSASEIAPVSSSKITEIDIAALKQLIKPNGKPRLINFWATWCGPCREEYPDLVKIDEQYRGKIDFLTVSLDDVVDKDTAVPKFLAEMKAKMPAYLLVASDDEAAMAVVSKNWNGALPFTILFDPNGGVAYFRQGKVRIDLLKAALGKYVAPSNTAVQK